MAIESKRGCGFRKVGGLYLVARPEEMITISCDRLPIPLHVCPVCSQGIKFSRSWTWIEPYSLFSGDHAFNHDHINGDIAVSYGCTCEKLCPACYPSIHFIGNVLDGDDSDGSAEPEFIKAGLVWIGEKYYSPESFVQELREQGFSKRLPAIPNGYKPGVTWIFTAHKKAVVDPGGDQVPGIFYAVQAPRVEKIVLQSEYDSYQLWKTVAGDDQADIIKNKDEVEVPDHIVELYKLEKKGIDLVPVPDGDKDHNPKAEPSRTGRHLRAV